MAAIVVPWGLYPTLGFSLSDALSPKILLETLWPVLAGLALALGLVWLTGDRAPELPPGDILALASRAAPIPRRIGDVVEGIEARLREWSIAGAMLLILAVLFGAALFAAR